MKVCGLNSTNNFRTVQNHSCTYIIYVGFLEILLSIVGITLNSTVLILFNSKACTLKKASYVLLVNQAVVDTYNCLLFMLPIGIINIQTNIQSKDMIILPGSPHSIFLGYILVSAHLSFRTSIFTFLVNAIERWLAVCRPLWHRAHVNTRNIKFAITIVWIFSLASSSTRIFIYNTKLGAINSIVFILTIIISTILYVATYIKARKRVSTNHLSQRTICQDPINKLNSAKQEKRLTLLFILMYIPFLLAFLPMCFVVMFFWKYYPYCRDLFHILLLLSSIVNPILTLKFRRKVQKVCRE